MKLSVAIPTRRFRTEESLASHLALQDTTQLIPLNRVQDLLLDSNAAIQGRYRISRAALGQLCSWLASGLAQYVANLSEGKDEVRSAKLAVRVINETIRLRFDTKIQGSHLLVDQRASRVDGLVGPRYQLFPNTELLSQCKEFVDSPNEPAVFHEAVVEGRRLLLRFRKTRPAFELNRGTRSETFTTGWHFANSEVGDRSIWATLVLIRDWNGATSMAPTTNIDKLVHTRSENFEGRLKQLLERLQRRLVTSDSMEFGVRKAGETRLGFPSDSVEKFQEHYKKVTNRLGHKLPRRFADRAVRRALFRTSEGVPTTIEKGILAKLATRTELDLYNAITALAMPLPIQARETAEQVAFNLLH